MSSRRGRAFLLRASAASALSLLCAAAGADLLFLRDGSQRSGALAACVGESCGFSGDTVARAAIVAIGFGDATTAAPTPTQTSTDEVHLTGGAVVVSPVVGISLGVVATASGSHDRDLVSWVFFAAPAQAPGEEPPVARRTPTPPPTPTPAPPPTPSPTPPPTPTPPPPTPHPPGAGAGGPLWIGTVHGIYLFTSGPGPFRSSFRQTIDAGVRLREEAPRWTIENGERIHKIVALRSEGSNQRETYTFLEEQPGFVTRCVGTGDTAIPDTAAGWIQTKVRAADPPGLRGLELPLGEEVYRLALFPPVGAEYSTTCTNPQGTWPGSVTYFPSQLGHEPRQGVDEPFPNDPETRSVRAGRMAGSYRREGNGYTVAFSWLVCREGVSCPEAPPPPEGGTPEPPKRPCDETAPDRAQLDLLLDQWRAYAEQLRGTTSEVTRVQQQADQWVGDFEHAMRDCELWGAAQLLVSLGTSGLVPGQPSGFTAFVNYGSQLEKMASGDPSWLLPTNNIEARGREWVSLENLYDAWALGDAHFGESSLQGLRERLQGCGAPTLDAVLDGAYAYLHLMEELAPLVESMHEQANRLRDHEEKLHDFCLSHARACEDYEACRDAAPAR